MWNLAFLFLFILHADGKSSNLCRMNDPRCSGNKVIKISVIKCMEPVNTTWAINEMIIRQRCDHVSVCSVNQLVSAVHSCCGDKAERPRLRFVYDCVEGGSVATTPPKMLTTTVASPVVNEDTNSKEVDVASGIYCETKMCQQKPYCSAGTDIAVLGISNSLKADEVMNSLTYYCNKRQRCSAEYQPYVANMCKSEELLQMNYVCMKEKVPTTVTCDFEETIDNKEGQIRSYDYPNMIPAGTSSCRIRIIFDTLSNLELVLLDLPEMEVMYKNQYSEWSPTTSITDKSNTIPLATEVLLSVNFDQLSRRRIWMYYRVVPEYQTVDVVDLPWMSTCLDHVTTPEPMNMTTPKSNPSTSEPSKVTMFKPPSSTSPSKDMHMMHTTKTNHGPEELSTAPHIVIPDGIPVDTNVVNKMKPTTIPAMPPTTIISTISPASSPASSSERDVSPVEKPPHHVNREKVSSVSDTTPTKLYSRAVVIGLIAGVVVLACSVIILLAALVASLRR